VETLAAAARRPYARRMASMTVELPVGAPVRDRAGRALLGAALLGAAFTVFAAVTTQDRAVRAHSPWQDDPYDALVSFTQLLVPVMVAAGVARAQLCRRLAPLPAARLDGLVRAARLVVLLVAATAGVDVVAVALGTHREAWTPVTAASSLAAAALVGAAGVVWLRLRAVDVPGGRGAGPDWAADAVQAQHLRFRLGRDAKITHIQVTLGGDLVRQYTSVDYAGRGGDCEAYGLYFAGDHQHFEHRLLVDHSVPDCRSYVGYRGALQGAGAHTVWVGDVLIRADATGTDTYEVNRNLVLTDGARADSVPNLEIETGEVVGAGHASATGRFDDEQLFYLMSRGISDEVARKLVVRGFFGELLDKIPVVALRERLGEAIESRLQEAGQ